MSRYAKIPIKLPAGVKIETVSNVVNVKGPKGTLDLALLSGIFISVDDDKVNVVLDEKENVTSAFHGLYRSLINNMVIGVSSGFEKKLSLVGVGYRAALEGNILQLQVGYSYPIKMEIPADLKVNIEKGTTITISGIDKQKVGQFTAEVRMKRPPEPFKGKGIRYENERVRKKAGKAGATKGKSA